MSRTPGKNPSAQSLIDKLDKLLVQKMDEYADLHQQLNKHSGRPLQDTDLAEVNRIINEIQVVFSRDIYPILHFIGHRTQFAGNAIEDYNSFIDRIKKAGAVEANA